MQDAQVPHRTWMSKSGPGEIGQVPHSSHDEKMPTVVYLESMDPAPRIFFNQFFVIFQNLVNGKSTQVSLR